MDSISFFAFFDSPPIIVATVSVALVAVSMCAHLWFHWNYVRRGFENLKNQLYAYKYFFHSYAEFVEEGPLFALAHGEEPYQPTEISAAEKNRKILENRYVN